MTLNKNFKNGIVTAMALVMVFFLAGCSASDQKKLSKSSVNAALNDKKEVTYDIAYIDQETSNKSGQSDYYSTDVIGYMSDGKEKQLRIALKDSTPNTSITYKTKILTNPDDKPTVTITNKDNKTTITVRRQPYQRYIQPNVSGTVTNKEENK